MADGNEASIREKMKKAAAGSMTTAKAVLIFYPLKGNVEVGQQVKPSEGVKDIAADAKENLEKLEERVKSAAMDADDADITEAEKPPEGENPRKRQEPDRKEDPYTVFFQFNPASLTIDVDSEEAESVANIGATSDEQSGQVEYGPINAAVTVSFKVVFDALCNQRAFLSDAVNPSPTNLGRQIANLASSVSYTVRPIVEFFLAAIRNIGTRRVDFKWGKMTYAGYLKTADCCYTMFDVKGEPVRAEIDLSLSCGGQDACNREKTWQERYAAFMSGENALSSFDPSNHIWRSAFVQATGFGKVEKACIKFHRAFLPATANQEEKPDEDFYVRVHYNPASITMKSEAGENETVAADSTKSQPNSTTQSDAVPMKTELSMELIFDETDNADAFMLDPGMASPTGLGRTAWHLKEKLKGREYSVAPISELFVAAMMFSYTRQVCFFWNEMKFAGELSRVNVEYTMFNNRGDPIRSRVKISICKSGRTDRDDDFDNIWKDVLNGNGGKRGWAENQEFLEESKNLTGNKGLTSSSGNYIVSNLFRM